MSTDTITRYLVVVGNPVDGITFYGPWGALEHAQGWGENNCGSRDWWVAPIRGELVFR